MRAAAAVVGRTCSSSAGRSRACSASRFAIGQHDLKRLLAYHSVENIGIICMGLGLALLGRSARPCRRWSRSGSPGALLHVWNHGLFKALLFLERRLGAARDRHARDRSPRRALGKPHAVDGGSRSSSAPSRSAGCRRSTASSASSSSTSASSGIGARRAIGSWLAGALAAPALALVGALAVACFVKVFGAVFLGQARTADAPARARGRTAPCWCRWRSSGRACLFIGLAAPLVVAACSTPPSSPGRRTRRLAGAGS